MIAAAKEIGVHKFIEFLPGGYDYNVQERGVMLSSGQRQLIAFLRAYMTNPTILVLDEATSSIDSFSDKDFAASKLMSTIDTFAPSLMNLSAIPFPKPDAAPVIMATLFNNLI